jgi:hypothetical protein
VLGIPVDFILFGLTLIGVAVFHRHTLAIALSGLAVISVYKLGFTGFKYGVGLAGFAQHIAHEWVILANLFLLLMGFALLSRHISRKVAYRMKCPLSFLMRLEGRRCFACDGFCLI